MAKAAKQEKAASSDLKKQSFVIQKGTSRSGRAIKPKVIFGNTVVEIAKQAKNNAKSDSLKGVVKVVKKVTQPVPEKSVEAKKEVVKTPVTTSPTVSPKGSPIPEGFTPVDIRAIISSKQQNDAKPKTVVAKVVAVSPATNANNITKTIVLSPVKKQLTYEQREKEIQVLRARLKKLEEEQETERKARAKINNANKVPEKVVKKTVVAKQVAPKRVTDTATTSDNRPARVKKPTWKAMEKE